MQQQAERTDRAIERLGRRMDSLGGRQHVRQLENYERALANVHREADSFDSVLGRLNRDSGGVSQSFRRVGTDSDSLSRNFRKINGEGNKVVTMLGRLGAASIGARAAMVALAAPAVIVAIGALVKAISPLTAGIVALVPQLVSAAGAIGAMVPQLGRLGAAAAGLPATFLGIGTAMATVKLATADLQEAYKGNEQALKRLTPEARSFLKTLQSYKPALNALRGTAQTGLFGGLESALKTARVALPYVNALLGDMSRRLGALAEQGARRFTQRAFLQDFLALGQQGGRIVSTLGRALMRVVNALRQVAVAAMPFTEWMRRTLEAWSIYIERSAIVARNTGRLAAFFNRARQSMIVFGHIARDVFLALNNIARLTSGTGMGLWRGLERATARFRAFTESFEGQARIRLWLDRTTGALRNMLSILGSFWRILVGVGRAAGALGDDLWASFRKTADSWADLVNSFGGQVRLRRFFAENRESIYQLLLLVQDVIKAIYSFGDQRGFPQMIQMIRRGVRALGELLEKMYDAFGPAVIQMIEQLGILLGNLSGVAGPITLMVKAFATLLRIINRLIDAIPGLGTILTAAITIYGINWAITKVRSLAASWGVVATQANAAAAAQARATGVGALPGRGWSRGPGPGGGPAVPPVIVGGPTGMGGRMRAAWAARGGGARAAWAAGTAGAGARLAGYGGAMGAGRAALGAAGRFIWPIAAIGGAFGAFTAPREGNIGYQAAQVGAGALSGATFGLVPRIRTGEEQANERTRRLFEGYTQRTGRLGFLPRGGLAGMAAGWAGQAGERRVSGLTERLEALGGAQPRGPRQARAQIRLMQSALATLRTEQGAAAAQARADLKQEIAVRRDAIAAINQQRRATRRLRAEARVERSRGRARGLLRDLGARFDVIEGARGTPAAFADLQERVRANLLKMRPAGRQMFVERLLGWASKNAPKQEAQRLRQVILDEWRKTGKNVEIVNGQVLTNSRANWRNIRKAMAGEAEQARQEVSKKFTQLQLIAAGQLRALGYSPAQANALVRAMERGAPGPTAGPGQTAAATNKLYSRYAFQTNPGYAQGGRIPGQGYRDTVNVAPGNMAAPGELIVNRHTEGRVNKFLGMFGHTLGGLVAKETRPHFMAMGGRVQAGISAVSNAVRSRFPQLSVTSTTEGRHAAGSYHYRGMAHDIGGPPGVMNAASEWIKASGLYKKLIEGIHNPNLSVKNGQMVSPSFWGAQTWAGHADHLHLAAGGGGALGDLALAAMAAGGGGGGGMPLLGALAAPASRLGGIPGAMSNQAGRRLAVAMRRRINRRIRAMGGGMAGAVAAAGGGGGGNAANMALGHRMLLAMGWGEAEWPALKTLWSGESGWRTQAANPSSGAYGIPQSLPGSKMASAGSDWKTNPATQIRWGLNYIRGRYGSPSQALAAWQKREPHWYAQGGRFTATSPTLIGVGERGRERVTIEPAGGRGQHASLGPFHFTIHNNRPGDVRRQVEEEVTQAMRSLARKVERMPTVGDSGVLA